MRDALQLRRLSLNRRSWGPGWRGSRMAGCRFLEGGADKDEVYTLALVQ
jgi:hypothetical protein